MSYGAILNKIDGNVFYENGELVDKNGESIQIPADQITNLPKDLTLVRGSYTGNGRDWLNDDYTNSISVALSNIYMFTITPYVRGAALILPAPVFWNYRGTSGNCYIVGENGGAPCNSLLVCNFNGGTVSWYCSSYGTNTSGAVWQDGEPQFNRNRTTYYWAALGVEQ